MQILNTIPNYSSYTLPIICANIIVAIFCVIAYIYRTQPLFRKFMIGFIIINLLSAIGGIIYYQYREPIGYTYEAIISDEFPVNTLYQNYKIIDKHGQIYQLEEID